MAGDWRLLRDPPAGAARNMSIDEALLARIEPDRPTLRLYRFAAPALSLGYRQQAAPWWARAQRSGLELVRRPSGGGCVVHAGDLVYCVAAPRWLPALPPDAHGVYAWVRGTLASALSDLGLAVAAARGRPAALYGERCFDASTGAELELGGLKLAGSAQRRTASGWLQHGSIRLADDSEWYARVFDSPAPRWAPLAAEFTADRVAAAIVRSFELRLGCALRPGELRADEREEAARRERCRQAAPLGTPAFPRRDPRCTKTADWLRR